MKVYEDMRLTNLEKKIISEVRTERREAWNAYQAPILKELEKLMNFESSLKSETHNDPKVQLIFSQIEQNQELNPCTKTLAKLRNKY